MPSRKPLLPDISIGSSNRYRVGVLLVSKRPGVGSGLLLIFMFYLQISIFFEWAMLGSDQRPLPCEGESTRSPGFTMVHGTPVTRSSRAMRTSANTPVSACTGVQLVYEPLSQLSP
jgi:hypothetical protein